MVTLPRAAKMLGVCRMTLYSIRKQFKIRKLYRASDGVACICMEDLKKVIKERK